MSNHIRFITICLTRFGGAGMVMLITAAMLLASCDPSAVPTAAPAATEEQEETFPAVTVTEEAQEPTPITKEEVTEEVVTEEVVQTVIVETATQEVQETVPAETVNVSLWMAAAEEETAQLLIEEFHSQNPDIQVELSLLSFSEFDGTLRRHLDEGNPPPDVATPSYNLLNELWYQGNLLPLEEFGEVTEPEDFVGDSLQSGHVEGVLAGLPHRRFACAPSYQYLAMFDLAGERGEAAFRLIDFLAQSDTQIFAYDLAQWYPTRESAHQALGLECPEIEPIRLQGQELLDILALAKELAPVVEGIIGQPLNPYESTAVIENGELQGIGIALLEDFPENATDAGEVWFGALIVEGAPEFDEPGAYALLCSGGDDNYCRLIREDGYEEEVTPEIFEPTSGPVEKPQVVVEPGSLSKCWYLDGAKVCIRVG